MNKVNAKKGFTLIELLIVIGILAILATVTLLVLNPAQMFAQARDAQRISDLNTVKSAISLYLSMESSPLLAPASPGCATTFWGTFGTTTTAAMPLWGATAPAHSTYTPPTTLTATTSVDGTGWIPVNLSVMSGGSPISSFPIDPANSVTQQYFYACSSTQATFKLVGKMESARYISGGSDDKESTDGGINAAYYETGTNLGASL